MSNHRPISTDEFLASIRPELVQAFSARPSFGRAGFRCVFREGQLERIEFEFAVSKMPQSREDG